MEIRRPLAALLAALALFGGGATMTACGDPATPNEGTTDDDSENTSGNDPGSEEQGNLPDNSDPEQDVEDQNDDSVDPD